MVEVEAISVREQLGGYPLVSLVKIVHDEVCTVLAVSSSFIVLLFPVPQDSHIHIVLDCY
jgi:hypothetical protein